MLILEEAMLLIENIVARHGLLTAVRDVSFSVNKGEVLAIIGANGAGKTTLFRTITGIHNNATGRVRLGGRDISQLGAAKRVAAGLAMVPEGRRLFSDMTVRENLQIAGENGRKGKWSIDRVLSAFPALKPILHSLAGNLSGGQRQAVAIGRALMTNPDAILFDEVSLGLSPIAIGGLYESLEILKKEGDTAMVIVEQDLDRAMSFSDRVACMLEGRVVLQGASAALTREAITSAYFGLDDGQSGERH
jgi:branched-chain amino acid transport system ATP-binding protein